MIILFILFSFLFYLCPRGSFIRIPVSVHTDAANAAIVITIKTVMAYIPAIAGGAISFAASFQPRPSEPSIFLITLILFFLFSFLGYRPAP